MLVAVECEFNAVLGERTPQRPGVGVVVITIPGERRVVEEGQDVLVLVGLEVGAQPGLLFRANAAAVAFEAARKDLASPTVGVQRDDMPVVVDVERVPQATGWTCGWARSRAKVLAVAGGVREGVVLVVAGRWPGDVAELTDRRVVAVGELVDGPAVVDEVAEADKHAAVGIEQFSHLLGDSFVAVEVATGHVARSEHEGSLGVVTDNRIGGGSCRELEGEAEIGAGERTLVNFDGDHVGPVGHKQIAWERGSNGLLARRGGEGAIDDRIDGAIDVGSQHLDTVYIDNRTVVAQHGECEAIELIERAGHKLVAEVLGDDPLSEDPIGLGDRGLVVVSVTELGNAGCPGRRVVLGRGPGDRFIGGVLLRCGRGSCVEVGPDRVRSNDELGGNDFGDNGEVMGCGVDNGSTNAGGNRCLVVAVGQR